MNSRSALGILWVWMILVVGFNHETLGCVEEERKGLLEFKAYVQPYLNNPTLLQSWVDDDSRSHECCAWERVECNSTTNRVIQLSLNNMIDVYFNLNVSLFLPFHELQNLSLSGNSIMSFVENQGLELLGRLKKLEVLDLSSNFFNNSIFPSLGALKSLKNLFLCENAFSNPFSFEGLEPWGRMEKLEVLDLCRNGLDNSILPYLGALKSLKILSLNENAFTNPFPEELAGLENLQMLDLSWNKLEGLKTLARLEKLEVLDFGNNALDNSILPSLGSLKSLKKLSLRQNSFTNPFPYEELSGLENLQILDLSWNGLSSTLGLQDQGFKHLDRLKNLEVLDFSHNSFGRSIIPNLGALKSQSLKSLDLSGNNIEGTFTGQEFANLYNLQMLYLSENGFNGTPQIIPGIKRLRKLEVLDISNNKFSTTILQYIGLLLPNIKTLYLGGNDLSGPITDQDLSTLSELELLDLSDTTLSYDFLQNIGEMVSLKFLRMGNIKGLNGTQLSFKGNVPFSLSKSLSLKVLDASDNNIAGRLPGWLGNLSDLQVLIMANNHFKGPIPAEFCALGKLTFVDLSMNNLNGLIPSCFPKSLEYVHLQKNELEGPIREAFSNSTGLVTLDISDNMLNGSLPRWIGNLSSLGVLLLKGNRLEGNIPIQLCHLDKINIMDLSHNNLSGPIPSCLKNLTFQRLDGTTHRFNMDELDDPFYVSGPGITMSYSFYSSYVYKSSLREFTFSQNSGFFKTIMEQVEFTTKSRYDIYKGIVLELIFGLDLSCNQLVGNIPPEIGELHGIHALNLSHNHLSGSIPTTISNLKQLESLDLSFNNLVGTIPPQITELHSLSVFTVAYNNLSGKTPEQKEQFATFGKSSYEGNPLLCGEPLEKSCPGETREPSSARPTSNDQERGFDMDTFIMSFVASYITVLLGMAAVFYINPYWRRQWFHLIHVCITSCYYFVVDNLHKFSVF
ncbi:PREDICTED: probable leucine-rich repeat receptor-like protein kinase At1g35710 isoform X2 [Nelumbo nucifera]|uniref:Probable leucine-rich repeat receptor-like protein kinase At1g35710 isoform X2 n=1 Tax=Nelumbo nucifera TaxID=4432 RepID=A0A1U7ZFU9_NELNU|nr:PREDICTED: probable leucine-rich repeat receptor-like protein kinase At1g35710 isoform X2 [Nelumbo nucifera]